MRVSYRVVQIPSELAFEVFKFVERASRSTGFTPTTNDLRERVRLVVDDWLKSEDGVAWIGTPTYIDLIPVCERLVKVLGGFFLAEKEG